VAPLRWLLLVGSRTMSGGGHGGGGGRIKWCVDGKVSSWPRLLRRHGKGQQAG